MIAKHIHTLKENKKGVVSATNYLKATWDELGAGVDHESFFFVK